MVGSRDNGNSFFRSQECGKHPDTRKPHSGSRQWTINEFGPQMTSLATINNEGFLAAMFVDVKLNILSCNQDLENLFQLEKNEIIGKNMDRLIRNEEYEERFLYLARKAASGETARGYGIIRVAEGKSRNVEFFGVPILLDRKQTAACIIFRDISEYDQVNMLLREQVLQTELILQTAIDPFYIADLDGTILKANQAASKIYGFRPDELVGRNILDFKIEPEEESGHRERAMKHGYDRIETKHRTRNGAIVDLEVSTNFVDTGDRKLFFSFFHDVTKMRRAVEALEGTEKELRAKKEALEELNTTLKVMLKKIEEEKQDLEENVLSNVKRLVKPYIEKLKTSEVNMKQNAYLEILEANIDNLVSPFSQKLTSIKMHLTPAELKIADLIRYGKTNKEIADLVNLSTETIKSHRRNIRAKLGINNKKTNLRSFLLYSK